MRFFFAFLFSFGAVALASQAPEQKSGQHLNKPFDACALLSKSVIEKVQGEPLKTEKPSSTRSGGVVTSQCFYSLSSSANSISLTVTLPDPGNSSGSDIKELWTEWFHEGGAAEKERDGAAPAHRREKEEEEASPPTAVPGLGDEAYWSRRFVGTLYVLKGNAIVRISIGGKQDDATRLQKAQTLARDALSKLR